jgi:hypothetical protein
MGFSSPDSCAAGSTRAVSLEGVGHAKTGQSDPSGRQKLLPLRDFGPFSLRGSSQNPLQDDGLASETASIWTLAPASGKNSMLQPRVTGVILMAISIVAFLGTTSDVIPSETFFPALALFAVGAVKFVRSNHEALEVAERRVHRMVNPVIRENRHAQALAARQAARRGDVTSHINAAEPARHETTASRRVATGVPLSASPWTLDVDESGGDFVVDTDVSFPVEVQRGDALADPLSKLNRLLSQGILTEEEYAVAKAKLLG